MRQVNCGLLEDGFFSEQFAPIVRPWNGDFQILAGHQRTESAREAKIDKIPCWVREMTDDEAFMLLATSNVQGELSGLEIGLHCLKAVPKAKGGKGQKGGVTEYANKIGKQRQHVSSYRQSAEVYSSLKPEHQCAGLREKALHLAAIHKAQQATWPVIVKALIAEEWSVKETTETVADIRELAIPGSWQKIFLPLDGIVAKMLSRKDFTASTVNSLVELANAGNGMIKALCSIEEKPGFIAMWHGWRSARR